MLKVYNTRREYIGLIDTYKNLYATELLNTGLKSLCFKAPCLEEYYEMLQEEHFIYTKDYNYVIKEVNYEGNEFFTIYATADIEEISGSIFMHFDCFERNLENAYKYCLGRTDWEVRYTSQRKTIVTYQLPYVTALDMLYQIAGDYQQELWFDTKNKILWVYEKMGKSLGAYYSNELRLKTLKKQSSTYDFATVLYPVGKDGLTIRDINNGHEFIDNYTYSDKYIEKIWINEDYDVAEKLKAAAEIYLDSIAQPKASYKLALSDIGPNVQLGDEILLVDKIKRIKQKQRVVKIIRYEEEPEKSQIELSNLQEDFARNFVKQQKRIEKQLAYVRQQLAELQ